MFCSYKPHAETVASATRKRTTGLNLLIEETKKDMQTLTTGISPPILAPPGEGATATMFPRIHLVIQPRFITLADTRHDEANYTDPSERRSPHQLVDYS